MGVVGNALEVVLDRGDDVGQRVHFLPVRAMLARQQTLGNITTGLAEQLGGTLQVEDGKTTAHGAHQLGNDFEVDRVPLRGNVFDDGILGLLKCTARLAQHGRLGIGQLVLGGEFGSGTGCRLAHGLFGNHAHQRGFDIKQCTGDVEQGTVLRRHTARGDGIDGFDLLLQDAARLAETEHGHGIRHLLEHRHQHPQVGRLALGTAHEQVERVLGTRQLLAQRIDHGLHGLAVRAAHAGALFADQRIARQGVVQAIQVFHRTQARRVAGALGHVIQQVLQQLGGRTPVGVVAHGTQLAVDLAEQHLHRGAEVDGLFRQALDQRRRHQPQLAQGRSPRQLLETGEHLVHVAKIGRQAVTANHAQQGDLVHLADLLYQRGVGRGRRHLDGRALARGKIRGEQRGFRHQRFAARGTQVVEQRQQHHRQVASRRLHALEIGRQLQDGAHQHFLAVGHACHLVVDQGKTELLHLLGKQGGAIKLDHLQGAVHLVQIGEAEAHARGVLGVLDERLQSLSRLLQRFLDFALDPVKCEEAVIVTHRHAP